MPGLFYPPLVEPWVYVKPKGTQKDRGSKLLPLPGCVGGKFRDYRWAVRSRQRTVLCVPTPFPVHSQPHLLNTVVRNRNAAISCQCVNMEGIIIQ